MKKHLACLAALCVLLYSAMPAFAAQAAAVPADALAPRIVIPLQTAANAFQRRMNGVLDLHALQLAPLVEKPELAASYIQAQINALPAEPQEAMAHLGALHVLTQALSAPPSAPVGSSLTPSPETARRLEALAQTLAHARTAADVPGLEAQAGAYAQLARAVEEIRGQTAMAGRLATLYDGLVTVRKPSVQTGLGKKPGQEWITHEGFSPAAQFALEDSEMSHLPRALREYAQKLSEQREEAMKRAQEKLQRGTDLQAWGLPNVVPVNQEKGLRYARLYRMNGVPTDLGTALHEVMAPLVGQDPAFLSRVTQRQLYQAVEHLVLGLSYSMDPDSEHLSAKERMQAGADFGEGFAYPEWAKALADKARAALESKPQGREKSAKLGDTPEERRPAEVLTTILVEMAQKFQELQPKVESGEAPESELQELLDLIVALHAIMGIPIRVGPNELSQVTVQHRQLMPILAELEKRKVHSDVVRAFIRSFPLGESLLRLGVHNLWKKGLTGKGIKVAIIDNGVDFDHPDLMGVSHLSENLTRDRGDHAKGDHATPMASIIHAIAPDAQIQSYQAWPNSELPGVTLNEEESLQATIAAMDLARANGANVINISGGFTMGYASDKIAHKVTELTDAGIVVIVSAGNEGDSMPTGFQIRSPASSPEAITVGAVDYHDKKADFSSGGMVFNPKNFTVKESPTIYAFGVYIKSAAQLPPALYEVEPMPYRYGSGTSPASPHVSGVVALMLQAASEAGAKMEGAAIPASVRAALLAAAQQVRRLPVLKSAGSSVEQLLKILQPA